MTRTHWIAVAVGTVALALLLGCPCAGVVVWRVFFHRSPAQRMLDDIAERAEKVNDEQADPAAIMSHRWWRRPITRAEMEGILDYLIATNADHWVFVDANLKMARAKNDLDTSTIAKGMGVVGILPANLDKSRFLYWGIDKFQLKRRSRQEAAMSLKTELDYRELRDGAGR